MDLKKHQFIIKAKRDSVCNETQNQIKEGDTILYLRGVKGISKATVYCKDSNYFKESENSILTGDCT